MHTTQHKKAKNGKSPTAAQRAAQSAPASAGVQKMPAYARRLVQAKVAVGPAGDSLEHEADSVAQRVTSGGTVDSASLSSVSGQKTQQAEAKKALPTADDTQGRLPEPVKKPEKKPDDIPTVAQKMTKKPPDMAAQQVQKAEAKNAPGTGAQQANSQVTEAAKDSDTAQDPRAMDDAAEQAIAQKGPGRPLNPATRQTLSERMQVDLEHVRIHDGPEAHEACRALHARAFTHGSDIWLATGETDTDIELMAHEVTHVIQQTDHVHRKVVQRDDKKPEKKDKKPELIDTAGAGKVTIPVIDLPKFKAEGREGKSPYKHKETMTVTKRPDTKQRKKWIGNLEEGVKGNVTTGVKELFDKAPKDSSGAASTAPFFTTAKSGKKANLKQWEQAKSKKPKAGSDQSPPATDVVLFGTQADVLKEVLVPYWNKEGKEHNFDIDHIKEMQLGGSDDTSNYELLDWEANRESGIGIRNELLRRFNQVLTENPNKAKDLAKKDMDALIDSGGKVEVEDFTAKLKISAKNTDVYWSFPEIQANKHLERLRPMTPEEVSEAGLGGSETELAIYSSRGGGRPRMISWEKDFKGEKEISINNFYYGFQLQKVRYGTSDDRLIGKLFVKGKVFSDAKAASEQEIQTDFDWKLRKSPSIKFGGYIDDTQVLPTLAANLTKASGLSPITFDGARLDETRGIVATGSIEPDVPLLRGSSIDFLLAGDEVRISKMFTAGEVSVPKPLSVSGASLEVFASTSLGFGVKGDVHFGIDRVGSGRIGATASTGKSLAEAGIALSGEFDFESKLFDVAHIEATYQRGEGGDYAFGIKGTAEIQKEGKVKGIKSAKIDVAYAQGVFAATGSAQLSIPGIQQATLAVAYDEKEGMVITGALTLAESKIIESGSGSVTVKKKEGEEYHVSASGKAVPKIPGISAAIGFRIDDDLFTVEGTAGYEKGMLKGSLLVGATNRPVGDDGKPAAGEPTKEITPYGGGSVTLKLAPWLQATAGIKILPNGEIEVVGKIGLPSVLKIFDEKKLDKNIFKINIDIPIIGISAAGQNVGIFATVGGGLDLSAGIGPGELQDVGVEVTYNPAREEDTHIVGTAKLHIPAHAGLRLFVRGGLGIGIPLVDARAGLEVGGQLGLEGALDAGVQVDWTPTKGLVIDAKGEAYVEPKIKFDIKAFVEVELDLWLKTITLYENSWNLAAFEWGSGLRFGLEFPIHYEEGKPFDVSMDDLKFKVPDIDPMAVLSGLVKQIAG